MAGQRRSKHDQRDRGGAEHTLPELGSQLRRLRSRCRRLKREAERTQGGPAWAQWSKAVDERDAHFARIARLPVLTLVDVAARFEAVAMELIDGDLILDDAARRRVMTLRGDLRRLARSRTSGME